MSEALKHYEIYKEAKTFLTWLESKKTYKQTDTSKMYNDSLEVIKTALEDNLINIKSIQYLEFDILRLEVLNSVYEHEITDLKREIEKKNKIIDNL